MEELTEEERKEIDKILNELNEETLEEFVWAKSGRRVGAKFKCKSASIVCNVL